MSENLLKRVSAGRIARPQKAVIYGPERIGKSTLASQFPLAVFVDTEGVQLASASPAQVDIALSVV